MRVYPRILLVMFLLAVPLYALTFQGGSTARDARWGRTSSPSGPRPACTVEGLGVDPWNLRQLESFQLAQFPGLAGPTAWVYPPTTLLLVWPLGHLPFAPAFVAWTIVGLVAFLGCLWFIVRDQRLAWPLVLAFPGLWLGIAHGQTQFVVAALMAGALLLLARRPRRRWRAHRAHGRQAAPRDPVPRGAHRGRPLANLPRGGGHCAGHFRHGRARVRRQLGAVVVRRDGARRGRDRPGCASGLQVRDAIHIVPSSRSARGPLARPACVHRDPCRVGRLDAVASHRQPADPRGGSCDCHLHRQSLCG